MTKLLADDRCEFCGGLLVPPLIMGRETRWPEADYVCLTCDRPYHWENHSPHLVSGCTLNHPDDRDDLADA